MAPLILKYASRNRAWIWWRRFTMKRGIRPRRGIPNRDRRMRKLKRILKQTSMSLRTSFQAIQWWRLHWDLKTNKRSLIIHFQSSFVSVIEFSVVNAERARIKCFSQGERTLWLGSMRLLDLRCTKIPSFLVVPLVS